MSFLTEASGPFVIVHQIGENKKMDDTGIEPGTSHMLSECDNQLHQTPVISENAK